MSAVQIAMIADLIQHSGMPYCHTLRWRKV
jgi:hypothetical protein